MALFEQKREKNTFSFLEEFLILECSSPESHHSELLNTINFERVRGRETEGKEKRRGGGERQRVRRRDGEGERDRGEGEEMGRERETEGKEKSSLL